MRKDSGTAYLLWLLGLCGFCGLHRFYLGQPVPGVLYLLTFGVCGIGQLIDLFLIPGEVQTANLRANGGTTNAQNIVVNVGETRQVIEPNPAKQAAPAQTKSKSIEHRILEQCSNQKGISLSQIIIATGEPIEKVKRIVDNLSEQNLLSQEINENGIILYRTN